MHEAVASPSISFQLSDVKQVAQTLLKTAKNLKIWLFYGDLGAGKTTLIKEICTELGIEAHVLSSPTFSIINEYNASNGKVFHFDFYRMKNETEILDLGIEEYFESGAYCFIEWPERLGSITPTEFFKVSITHTGPNNRLLEFEKHG
jgi:tRNA threonylcarbamoyladenosine biosynthesis protein TsaE